MRTPPPSDPAARFRGLPPGPRGFRPLLRREDGQASLLLLSGLTLSMMALILLFIRVGSANDIRSQAQTAADAAALAAVSEMQDRAARQLANAQLPGVTWSQNAGKSRAEEYARSNDAVLTDIRASDDSMGRTGNVVRVEVRGALCQRELEEDASRHWGEIVCDGTEDDEDRERPVPTHVGTAAAIARIDMPTGCGRQERRNALGVIVDAWVQCGGQRITSVAEGRRHIDVRLVDQEGRYIFNDAIMAGGGVMVSCSQLGQLHPSMCAAHEALSAEFGPFWLSAGGYRNEMTSDHGYGQAVDYMVAAYGGRPSPQMHATAVTVIDWLIENSASLQVKCVIYDRHIWNRTRASPDPVGPWESVKRYSPRYDRGNLTQDHVDHIHLAAGPGRCR